MLESLFSDPRENQNIITPYIDASTVYGSTLEKQQKLRDPDKRQYGHCLTVCQSPVASDMSTSTSVHHT